VLQFAVLSIVADLLFMGCFVAVLFFLQLFQRVVFSILTDFNRLTIWHQFAVWRLCCCSFDLFVCDLTIWLL
jgi:hypothetical protein